MDSPDSKTSDVNDVVTEAMIRAAVAKLDWPRLEHEYWEQDEFLYLNNFLPPEVLRVWEQELMHWFWRFVSNMKDSIAYFGFRQVLFKRGLDGANDSKHP